VVAVRGCVESVHACDVFILIIHLKPCAADDNRID
jgi:hypothetical protein